MTTAYRCFRLPENVSETNHPFYPTDYRILTLFSLKREHLIAHAMRAFMLIENNE
ncbi:MAG: hypothetical protein IJ881_07625 [Neisseriaceae bacterium]|nr:hypothetical protein [Neisseriaceae bacterium]MBR3426257.1 hypothetical protein [Neisseriaceae bacterium]